MKPWQRVLLALLAGLAGSCTTRVIEIQRWGKCWDRSGVVSIGPGLKEICWEIPTTMENRKSDGSD